MFTVCIIIVIIIIISVIVKNLYLREMEVQHFKI